VLHDIGKIHELNYERGFSYSNDGQLLGHMAIALRMIADKLRSLPEFPPTLRSLVEHMVLSHHGQLEFGSPKLPQFPEALLLHYIDDLDSKMECMRALIEHDRQLEGCFTTYNTALARPALKKDRYLNGPEEPQRSPVSSAPERSAADALEAPVAEPAMAAYHGSAPKPGSLFADKLKHALAPADPESEG
jgi:3'-5' exoribonuclease